MKFVDQLETWAKESLNPTNQSGALVGFRQSSWEQYKKLRLPERKSEAWKYSNLDLWDRQTWTREQVTVEPSAISDRPATVDAETFAKKMNLSAKTAQLVKELSSSCLVVGVHPAGLLHLADRSSDQSWPSGLAIQTLQSSANHKAYAHEDGLSAAVAATATSGFELRVNSKTEIRQPVLLLYPGVKPGAWSASCSRIVLEAGSRLQLVDGFFAGENFFADAYGRADVSHVEIGAGAHLSWVRLQSEAKKALFYSQSSVRMERDAGFESMQLATGAEWSRQGLKVEIEGEQAEARVMGLTFASDQQHVDQRIDVQHHIGHSTSSQVFKSVLKDQARGVLNGKIRIAQHAQKVNSSQLNHNLLLSRGAEADTKPELEIYADDVKANHGASIGRLDDDELFYLQSRGLTLAEAKRMLARAFASDVVMKVESKALRGILQAQVDDNLLSFLTEMESSL